MALLSFSEEAYAVLMLLNYPFLEQPQKVDARGWSCTVTSNRSNPVLDYRVYSNFFSSAIGYPKSAKIFFESHLIIKVNCCVILL